MRPTTVKPELYLKKKIDRNHQGLGGAKVGFTRFPEDFGEGETLVDVCPQSEFGLGSIIRRGAGENCCCRVVKSATWLFTLFTLVACALLIGVMVGETGGWKFCRRGRGELTGGFLDEELGATFFAPFAPFKLTVEPNLFLR